ncbi:hypothetical protein EK21DRAFT_56186 [Setomelanomma holmii]|uniref:Nucleolar protein Dnt1-like N-terminal domain-containing protein n=1 Tax=Setomelanomma holmii TaxID=210430 RepID=A0A9P4HK98_9PLEO|nr:hypothetical protein EK21DRAFT_56186 [Setomelanomma holmii]
MAASGTRMRLTVEVLPLTEENAHGPYRDEAIAVFKGRKFALPVHSENTLEQVWTQIEQRYKTNYLDALQAANFTIKKLQDAYDCDLDLGDTVSSIFEGETDPTMRMIKVVPSFVYRDFSVPVTSNLRPAHAQKRIRELNGEIANKRRRIELGDVREEVDPSRDQPVPSTESERSREGSLANPRADGRRAGSRARRSHTGGSLVFVNNSQTGQAEFGTSVKEESPEPGFPPPAPKATVSEKNTSAPNRCQTKSRTRTPRARTEEEVATNGVDEVPETDDAATVDMQQQDAAHEPDTQEAAIQRSPQSTPARSQRTPQPAATKRRDIYDVPSSPEFMSNKKAKAKKTYSRSPRTATTVQKEVDLLNSSRRWASSKPAKPGRLKKPTKTATPITPSSAKGGIRFIHTDPSAEGKHTRTGSGTKNRATPSGSLGSAVKTLDPDIHAAVSNRSSPAVTRRPARFLSRSPTPEPSASDAESEETSAAPSKNATPQPNNNQAEGGSSSDSSSDSDESSTDDEDVEMPDLAPDARAESALNPIPSSPPHLTNAPASTPLVPETRQSLLSQSIRQTPIPLPTNTPSSQSVFAQAAARRPGARYAGFRTLREQLADAKTTPTASQKKVYDPRMLNLSKLAAKGKGAGAGKPMMGVGLEEEESSDETSSSSSDSD